MTFCKNTTTMKNDTFDINDAFNSFLNDVYRTLDDYTLFTSILYNTIESIQNTSERSLYSSGLIVRNINSKSGNITDVNSLRSRDIDTLNIQDSYTHYNTILTTLILLKMYNSLEIFLFQSIWVKHYSAIFKNPSFSKNESDKLINAMKTECGCKDTKNNKFLIEYIKYKHPSYVNFLKLKASKGFKKANENFENFFDFFSTIRNTIAHNSSLINKDIINGFRGHFFKHFFQTSTIASDIIHYNPKEFESKKINIKNNSLVFNFKEPTLINDFTQIVLDFAVNTIKEISNEDNLDFLGTLEAPSFGV